jgi:hypothetical protein
MKLFFVAFSIWTFLVTLWTVSASESPNENPLLKDDLGKLKKEKHAPKTKSLPRKKENEQTKKEKVEDTLAFKNFVIGSF